MKGLNLKETNSNTFGEQYFESINQLAFAKSSSEDVFAPFYKSYLDEEEALYIVIGTDSGLLHKFVRAHIKHKFCKFVFIEFSEVLQALNIKTDVYQNFDNEEQQVWVFDENFDLPQLNRGFGNYIIRRRIHLIKSLAVMDAKPSSSYLKLWDQFEVAYSHYVRGELNSQSAKVFEEQRFLNMAQNVIPALELNSKLEGRDAIILGGGPTLDDAIDWVRDNQDKLIIFAAARIAKRMEKEGILVDFFVTVDPFPWSFDNSKALLTHSEYSILVHSFHAQHRLISQWNGLSCYLGQRFGWYSEDEKLNYDGPGPTVTNTALHIAATLGAKRMFLSGIDFCFAKGKTHESSSVEAQHQDTVAHHGKAMLEDNAGNMTETGDDFYSAKQAMEGMIRYYLAYKPHLEFISLGLNSAKMENVSYKEYDTIVLSTESKQSLIEEIKVDLTLTVDEQQQMYFQFLDTLEKQKKRFKKILDNSKQAVDVVSKIYNKKGEVVEKQASKIKKIQKKVNSLVGKDGDYLTSYQAALFSDSFKPIEDEQAMTQQEVKQQLEAFFGGMKNLSGAMLTMIKQAIDRVQLSLDEIREDSLPSKLYSRWERWGEFGRALQWSQWHDVKQLSGDESHQLQKAIDAFYQEFDKTDHQYQQMLEQNINNVSKILARANNAFAKGDAREIDSIVKHVNQLKANNKEQKQDFIALMHGMLSELKGDQVAAFNFYEPITLPFLRHIALKKMLPIALDLEDYAAALTVLERLVEFNLDYMPSYADMLKVLGNIDGAIEVLNMYMNKYPNKLSVKNKLAQLFIENSQFGDAKSILNTVLSEDPENKTALFLNEMLSSSQQ